VLVLLVLPMASMAADKVRLFALFNGKAIIMVEDQRYVLREGEATPGGIRLIETNTAEELAVLEINGRKETLKLGSVLGSKFVERKQASVVLWANHSGHFLTSGSINDIPVRFLVDTGATDIAMSSIAADRIGLRYKSDGRPGVASTASGLVRTYNLKLTQVKVGDIVMHNVDAGIIEGSFPQEILLGMSFLGKLDMRQEGSKMELKKRF